MADNRYSLTRFSVPGTQGRKTKRSVTIAENLDAIVGSGKIRSRSVSVLETFNGTIYLSRVFPRSFKIEEKLNTSLIGGRIIIRSVDVHEQLAGELYLNHISSRELMVEELLDGDLLCNKQLHRQVAVEELLENSTLMSRNHKREVAVSDILSGIVTAIDVEVIPIQIDITIPPGGELRVASDGFTVTLNGENIMYAHQGSWIFIDRETLELKIDNATSGQLTGALIYQERYL